VKAIIVYDSHYGNTEKLAFALAAGLQKNSIDVEVFKVGKFDKMELVKSDFIAIGGPTHIASVSKPMKEFLSELKNVSLRGKLGFAFDTRNESRFNIFDINSAARGIEGKMKRSGIIIVHPRESALVEGREGPLIGEGEGRFVEIGKNIAERLNM
jgi:flavodoxin